MDGDGVLQKSPQRIFHPGKLPTGYVGSSNFGYSLPGTYDSQQIVEGSPNIVVLNGDEHYDEIESDYAAPSNVIRLVSGQPRRRRPRKPVRQIIITGHRGVRGKTMRTSENIEYVEPMYVQSGRRKGKRKKPIPVGEKFRLP